MLLVSGNGYGGIYIWDMYSGNHTGNSLSQLLLQSTHYIKNVALSVVSPL